VAYEFYSDRDGNNPFLFLMDEIMGSSSVMIASELLTNTAGGKGIMLGGLTGVSATEVIVIGTDLAAEYAVKVAKSLGATVKVFDRDLSGLWRMENKFGTDLFTSTLNYKMLEKSLASADVLINTKTRHSDEEYIITAEMVKRMKHGAIIVDIRTDVGSVIETSRPTTFEHPMYEKYGVIHYCVPNIPSRVAKTASIAISNVLTQILLEICRAGNFYTVLRRSDSLRNGVYTFLGKLTNSFLAEKFHIEAKNIDLLLALL
jgi:alanine dehydrogenase